MQADKIDIPRGNSNPISARDALQFQREGDIVDDIAPRKRRFSWKTMPMAGWGAVDRFVLNPHGAMACCRQSSNDVEQGRLSATRRTDDGNEFPGMQSEGYGIDCGDGRRAVAKPFGDLLNRKRRGRQMSAFSFVANEWLGSRSAIMAWLVPLKNGVFVPAQATCSMVAGPAPRCSDTGLTFPGVRNVTSPIAWLGAGNER